MRLFNTCFLQKRSKIGFDEADEEEMQDLLSTTPTCPITNAGRSYVAEDAWVGPDPIGSGAQGASSAAEAPEEGVKILFEPVDREREILENAPTTEALPEEDAVTVAFPPTWLFLEPSHHLGSRGQELLKLRY